MKKEQPEDQSISINDMEYLPVTNSVKESLRVQKTEYIRQQMRKRQEQEDALMAQLLQEQRIIDGLQEKINENLEQTEESSKYNQEFRANMNAQIYALHGVSEDKMEGMREYKHAYYQGCAFSLFLLSAALIILCGVLHGFQSEICVFMLAYTGIEGALLTQEKKRIKPVDWICKLLYLLMFPAMMVMFVCFELGFAEYQIFLPYASIAGICILIFASISYFLYNPYRSIKKKIRDAKGHIEDIEKIAKKQVRKNEKKRVKAESKLHRQLKQEDKQQARQLRRENRKSKFTQMFHFHKKTESSPETPDETGPEMGQADEYIPNPEQTNGNDISAREDISESGQIEESLSTDENNTTTK